MAKNKLTAIAIKRAGDGKHQDGGGLILVKKGEAGKWIYRYSHLGRRREMGLGHWPTVSLAEARKMRDEWLGVLAAGMDPISEREARRAEEVAHRDRQNPTYQELVSIVFEARKENLREQGDRGRWLSPLRTHIIPRIGKVRTSDLTRHVIADALRPIWRTKHPTALKAYRRTKIVLTEAQLMGFDCNPIEVDAAKRILGDHHHEETPIASTSWQDLPALYARLGDSVSAQCLKFIILTAVRSDAARGARLGEMDLENDIWTVPKERVKGLKQHVRDFRVPLSRQAKQLIEDAAQFADDLLFVPMRAAISSRALETHLDDLNEPGRPHGFRTSFRTWVQDNDAASWEVSETVLGHTIGNKVERTYARSDLLDRRRIVMQAWADFVTGEAANVLSLDEARMKR
ncbi:tyrosine-type recombinase/integrase [Paracoccus homiensis]|uniref:Phage integrase family protein n=1 Tax=Paracoccus homiensis TaxID=364199 RepID=A0A1H9YD22_9RHOB|nr:integrase arm-type DNA-binding domain-containing protein [Paracoccus homiensis]SES66866.1 Phage integrase family protein [Paracoccus homiensis]